MTQRILILGSEDLVSDFSPCAKREGMEFVIESVDSAERAQQLLAEGGFDVVLGDASLSALGVLDEVARQHPETLRILLTEYHQQNVEDEQGVSAHHVLHKPCAGQSLVQTIQRGNLLRETLTSDKLAEVVKKLHHLPSYPRVYQEVCDLLESPSYTIADIAHLVMQDPALGARVLQTANSSYFGFQATISSIERATSLLGTEMIKNLVFANELFDAFKGRVHDSLDMDSLWNHSLTVGGIAKSIASRAGFSKQAQEEAFAAGLLHDIGKLALASNLADDYKGVVVAEDESLEQAETRVFGASHAQIGAYLLHVWNLPERIIEVVAFHHSPDVVPHQELNTLAMVHLANQIDHIATATHSVDAVCAEIQNYAKRWAIEDIIEQVQADE